MLPDAFFTKLPPFSGNGSRKPVIKKVNQFRNTTVKYIIWLFLFKFAGFIRDCEKIGHFPMNSPEKNDLI
jgi:hypothetical protein